MELAVVLSRSDRAYLDKLYPLLVQEFRKGSIIAGQAIALMVRLLSITRNYPQ